MSTSVTTPLLPTSGTAQSEGTRSFTVEMEEAAALPLESSSAVPHTPLRDVKAGGSSGSNTSGAMRRSNSEGSSLASPGVSGSSGRVHAFKQPLQQQQQPLQQQQRPMSSRRSTAAGSSSVQLLTCRSDTPAAQRTEEIAASRDSAFHPMIVCPLQNLGNTCYFNSGVQMLANCPALVYALRNSPFVQAARTNSPLQSSTAKASPTGAATTKLCLRGGDATHALFEEFAGLLSRMENNNLGSGEALSPVRALDALARVYTQFEGRSQQDAAEMMTALLASLEEEGGQYAEVEQVLSSFAEDAILTHPGSSPNPTSTDTQQQLQQQPQPHRSEPYFSDEFSQASPVASLRVAGAVPGARSAHAMAVLRFMKQVNTENEQLERRVKQRQGKPYLGTFRPPRLHYNPVMDGFHGHAVSQVECHHCRRVSRVVSDYNALLIDVPTSRQRSQFAARHPNVRRLAPDGQPLQAKKHAGFTWWNPLSFFTSAWDHLTRLFTSSVPFPLTLQECLDIHFEPVKLQGSNKYQCDSCGTVSEATKSETLLGLPEYLVLHMKRFEAGRCFNSKKTDPVIFPASWTPLTEAAAAKAQPPRTMPEILDLRRYLHGVAAPFAEPIPPCLRASLGANAAIRSSNAFAEPTATAGAGAGGVPPASPSASQHPQAQQQEQQPASTLNADGAAPWAIPTTYTLDGIVNHHGGYEGGHYTVFLYKSTTEQSTWVYISDDEIEKASAGEAADSEEYVLLYRRQPMVQAAAEVDEAVQLRQKACYYLSRDVSTPAAPGPALAAAAAAGGSSSLGEEEEQCSAAAAASSSSQPVVYISRLWLQRVAFLSEPGPIVNRLCYCTPADQAKLTTHRSLFPSTVQVPEELPHVHGPPVEWFYVPISRTDYAIFYDAFGGNAAVTAAEVKEMQQRQEQFAAAIATAERAKGRNGVSTRPLGTR